MPEYPLYTISIHSSIACIQHSYCHTVSTDTSVLSRLFLGVMHPPPCANVLPYQCFRGCCTPIRMMACKADLYSIIITQQLYTWKYTAIDYAIGIQPCTSEWLSDRTGDRAVQTISANGYWKSVIVGLLPPVYCSNSLQSICESHVWA